MRSWPMRAWPGVGGIAPIVTITKLLIEAIIDTTWEYEAVIETAWDYSVIIDP